MRGSLAFAVDPLWVPLWPLGSRRLPSGEGGLDGALESCEGSQQSKGGCAAAMERGL